MLSGLGFITALGLFYRPILSLHKLTMKRSPNLSLRYGRDSYGIVTGASDGIGKGFVKLLLRED